MSNEIVAYFKGRVGVAESVYQYDYGRVLIIDGLELPSVFEAHFAMPGDEEAIIVAGQDNRVAIPNACLDKTGVVTMYIYDHSGQNDGETEYVVRFNVIRRAKPMDDGTPEEKSHMSEAIALMQHASIEGNVKKWLEEHPEATTTVQDGAITFQKLALSLRNIQIINSFDDILATTANRILVLKNNSPYGDDGYCFFEVRENEDIGGYVRNDGSVVFPTPNQSLLTESNPPTKSIADVATSYYDRDNLKYGNKETLFNTNVGTEIDCSAYVCAVLQGIDYDHSRYVSNSNVFSDYIGNNRLPSSTSDRTDALLTWELAQWFAERRQLYTLQSGEGAQKMQFGDILFFSTGLYPNRYLGIDHCALIVETFPDQTALILQAGLEGTPHMSHNNNTVVKMSLIDVAHYVGQNLVAFARPSYGVGSNKATRISSVFPHNAQEKTITEGSTLLTSLYLDAPLKPRTLYSLNLKGNLVDYAVNKAYMYANIVQDDGISKNFIRWVQGEPSARDKALTIMGVTPADLGINPRGVNIRANGFTGASGTAQINYAMLYEGVSYNDPSRIPYEMTSPISGFVNESYIYEDALYLKFRVPLGTLTGEFEIATLSNPLDGYASEFFFSGFVGYVDCIPIRMSNGKLYAATATARNASLRVFQKLELF